MTYDVFISYSKDDQKIVEGLSAYLEQNKIRCFVAYRDIPRGFVWAKAITEAIENSKLMVVIFSEQFNKSEQVDREIEMCIEERKPILTFRIEDTAFTGAKKYYLKNINWIDAFPNPEKCFIELLASIIKLYPKIEKKDTPYYTRKSISDEYLEMSEMQNYDNECVLVPSYFNILQRREVKDSHEQNGFKCNLLLSQTNAIALALYANKEIELLRVSIVIFENNSIEISILEIGVGVFEVRSTGGDAFAANAINLISNICKDTLQNAEFKGNIDELVIISNKSPNAEQLKTVETIFGKVARKMYNLSEMLVKGKDIMCGVRSGIFKNILLLDVIPFSIGIETMGGVMTKLIVANSTIPYKKTETFTTAVNNQPSVELHILQGEQPLAKDNLTIGRFHLDGILPALRGVPQIEVTFDIDVNGILSVSAKDQITGKEVNVKIF